MTYHDTNIIDHCPVSWTTVQQAAYKLFQRGAKSGPCICTASVSRRRILHGTGAYYGGGACLPS